MLFESDERINATLTSSGCMVDSLLCAKPLHTSHSLRTESERSIKSWSWGPVQKAPKPSTAPRNSSMKTGCRIFKALCTERHKDHKLCTAEKHKPLKISKVKDFEVAMGY